MFFQILFRPDTTIAIRSIVRALTHVYVNVCACACLPDILLLLAVLSFIWRNSLHFGFAIVFRYIVNISTDYIDCALLRLRLRLFCLLFTLDINTHTHSRYMCYLLIRPLFFSLFYCGFYCLNDLCALCGQTTFNFFVHLAFPIYT